MVLNKHKILNLKIIAILVISHTYMITVEKQLSLFLLQNPNCILLFLLSITSMMILTQSLMTLTMRKIWGFSSMVNHQKVTWSSIIAFQMRSPHIHFLSHKSNNKINLNLQTKTQNLNQNQIMNNYLLIKSRMNNHRGMMYLKKIDQMMILTLFILLS